MCDAAPPLAVLCTRYCLGLPMQNVIHESVGCWNCTNFVFSFCVFRNVRRVVTRITVTSPFPSTRHQPWSYPVTTSHHPPPAPSARQTQYYSSVSCSVWHIWSVRCGGISGVVHLPCVSQSSVTTGSFLRWSAYRCRVQTLLRNLLLWLQEAGSSRQHGYFKKL